jgi:isopenicillin N synthase-like dioxygenase
LEAPFSVLSLEDLDSDLTSFSNNLGESFKEWGFCGIKNHGVDTELVTQVQEMFIQFFSFSEEKKKEYFRPEYGGARGYTPFKIETAKDANIADLKEFWHVGRDLEKNDPYRRWMHDNLEVSDISSFKEKTNQLFLQFDELGNELLKAISLYLNLQPDYFKSITNKGNSVMRVIHYPPINSIDIGERAGAHEDINLITLLIGGQQAGLEILSNQNEWLRASVDDGVIICNIGDMLQRLTNNNLKSTTHRVKAIGNEMESSRYSIPFFVHPNPDWYIETLHNQISIANPDSYPNGILAEDYLQERLKEIKLS